MSTPPSSEPSPSLPEADPLADIVVAESVDEQAAGLDRPPANGRMGAELPVPRIDTSMQWGMLLTAACVITLAAILQVRGSETVVIPVVDMALPGTCTYKKMVGLECPGCGLTRCFISLAHGEPVAAWYFNPAGILFFALVAAQIPFRGIQIWRIRQGLAEIQLGRIGHWLLGILALALFAQWVLRTFLI